MQPTDTEWERAASFCHTLPGSRQVYCLDIDLVQTPSSMAVPLMGLEAEQGNLNRWAGANSGTELREYQQPKNARSIDGFATALLQRTPMLE